MAVTSDGAGYESEPNGETVKYDNIPPRITTSEATQVEGTPGQNSWYTSQEVKINIEAEDTPAGILDGYVYKITNKTTNQTTTETHQKDIDKQITIEEDGEYTVNIQAIDQAGNKSPTRTIEIKKDSIKPTVGTPEITNITETSFQISISYRDDTSKIAYFEYYLNGTLVKTDPSGITTIEGLTANQTYSVIVKAYDNAGNISQESDTKPVTTKGELKAPNVSVSGTTRNGYYIGTVTITVSDTSNSTKTRVARIKVIGAGSERTITGTSGSFTITADGTYTISAWSEDTNGNRSDTTTKPSFTRDATAPRPTLGTPETNSSGTIKVKATANETGGSGVKSYEFQYKTSTSGVWTRKALIYSTASSYTYTYTEMGDGKTVYIRVLVTDRAGNIGKSAEDSSNGISAVIPKKNTAPKVTASYANDKGTDYIKINATGTDNEGGILYYTLYVKTASGSWESKATKSETAGQSVTMIASGLAEYTDYYYKVTVRDNGNLTGTTEQLGLIRTYCPGLSTKPSCTAAHYIYEYRGYVDSGDIGACWVDGCSDHGSLVQWWPSVSGEPNNSPFYTYCCSKHNNLGSLWVSYNARCIHDINPDISPCIHGYTEMHD
ncbi:MAG: hypothetical protein HFJ52_03600 [Clostridia bacterium]|nr:hypothetical protein [Clostridia bacterium]